MPTTSFRPHTRAEDPFPNIGLGGTLVTVFVSSFFAAKIVCNATVLLLYGRHAFFDQGLRVENWKHSILSNGEHLAWYGTLMIGPTILPIIAATLFAAEFVAKRLRAFLAARSRWLTAAACLIGAAALFAFSFLLYSEPQPFPFGHPVPFSAFIAAALLLWKAASTLLANVPGERDTQPAVSSQTSGQEYSLNLSLPAFLVATFVTCYVAIQVVRTAAVLLSCGFAAYFKEGVRLSDWQHLTLSNGTTLPWWAGLMIGPGIVPVWALLILGTEFAAGRVRALFSRGPLWAIVAARLVGGVALLAFSSRIQSANDFGLILCARISAYIAGLVLLWKAVAAPFRKRSA